MSWKSLVCAGLLCALVTPVWAQPSLVVGNPTIDMGPSTNSNWKWNIQIAPVGVGAIDAELAISAVHSGLVVVNETNSALWDHDTPANKPDNANFAFWDEFDDFGVQFSGDHAMVGLGSGPQSGTATIVQVETAEPFYVNSGNHNLTTRINIYGGYDGDTAGRLAQSGNNNSVSGQFQFYIRPGDADLSGGAPGANDFNIWKNNPGTDPLRRKWTDGDWNGDDSIGASDFNIWLSAPNPGAEPFPGGGAGAGSGLAAVPEPSSLVLAGIMALALAGFRRVRGL